jgi:ribonuclease P protein component
MPHTQPSVESLAGFGSFTRVITRGKKYEKKPIKAFVYASFEKKTSLSVGFAVSKGIRSAVHRNRVKRLMRQAFQASKMELINKISAGMLIEIVFMYSGDSRLAPPMVQFGPINKAFLSLCKDINVV